MEEHFDMEMDIHAKLKFNQLDRVWLLCRGEYTPYIRERTCVNTHENRWFSCSACGYGFVDMFPCDETDINEQPHYCPNCGARVISEEEQGHGVADAIRRLEKAVKQ